MSPLSKLVQSASDAGTNYEPLSVLAYGWDPDSPVRLPSVMHNLNRDPIPLVSIRGAYLFLPVEEVGDFLAQTHNPKQPLQRKYGYIKETEA